MKVCDDSGPMDGTNWLSGGRVTNRAFRCSVKQSSGNSTRPTA